MKIMDVITSQVFDNFPEISGKNKFPESLQPYIKSHVFNNRITVISLHNLCIGM